MQLSKKSLLSGLTILFMTTFSWSQDLPIDGGHSRIGFKVKHLGISYVKGNFDKFTGTIKLDEKDKSLKSVAAEIDAASVNTNNKKRDGHLSSPDFFDVKKTPNITFKSTSVKKDGDKKYKVVGDLTIRGIKKEVTLNVDMNGIVKNPWGMTKVAYTGTGQVNRKDYGLTWNKALEAGGFLVGDMVTILLEIEAVIK